MVTTIFWALLFAAAAAWLGVTLNRWFVKVNSQGYRPGSTFATFFVSFLPMLVFMKIASRLGIPEGHMTGTFLILALVTTGSIVYGLISGGKSSGGGPGDKSS